MKITSHSFRNLSFILYSFDWTNKLFTSLFDIVHVTVEIKVVWTFAHADFRQHIVVSPSFSVLSHFSLFGVSLNLCILDHSNICIVMIKSPFVSVFNCVYVPLEYLTRVDVLPWVELICLENLLWSPFCSVCFNIFVNIHG